MDWMVILVIAFAGAVAVYPLLRPFMFIGG